MSFPIEPSSSKISKEAERRKYLKNLRKNEYHVDTITETLQSLFEELLWKRDFEGASDVLTALMNKANKIPEMIFKVSCIEANYNLLFGINIF